MADDKSFLDYTRGLREIEPFTVTVKFGDSWAPNTCQAEPCARCGACPTCRDFHFYGRGCTDECPQKAHRSDQDE